MEKPYIIGISSFLSFLFLIFSCVAAEIWWPLFNVLFMLLVIVPSLFGALESTGLLGSLGDFISAVFAFSAFAFPFVLFHSDVIGGGSFCLILLSNICAVVAVFVFIQAQLDDVY
mmetsp:Transcript_436/g.523  ORF Transcript_436/g.523 Transcript_436/m.523 type:complete len:115 (+) Transcript_436:198-542(+)